MNRHLARTEQEPEPGTAGWWLARSNPLVRCRARKDGLTEERITAALHILETEGLDALTMRRVAAALGTGQASLYRHVAGREELVVLVVDHVLGLFDDTPPAGHDWRQIATWAAGRFRRLLDDPAVVPLVTGAQMLGPNSMRGRELALGGFVASGFSPEVAVRSYLTIVLFTVVSVQLALRASQERTVQEGYFAQQDPDQLSVSGGPRRRPRPSDSDAEFEFGLTALFDGIARHQSPPGG